MAETAWTSTVSVAQLKKRILAKLAYSLGKTPLVAAPHDWLTAGILALRDEVVDVWHLSTQRSYKTARKRVYYLSLEFLIGRLFAETLNNLGLTAKMREALGQLGVDLSAIEPLEPDAALGNGGLGRLAACYLESMASVGIAAFGYGIRYDFGLFKQRIVNGEQVEAPEDWLIFRNPWEFSRRESTYEIGFGGTVAPTAVPGRIAWTPQETIYAVAYDTPVAGWKGREASILRLWSAQALHPLHLDTFNKGDHLGAIAEETRARAISNLLYPADTTPQGQELRLRQEYFFASASLQVLQRGRGHEIILAQGQELRLRQEHFFASPSLQDLLRRHLRQFKRLELLPDKVAIHLNDTHPALAVAELMRLLVDVHGLEWNQAWDLTRRTISYTNHTLLPEALETWPVSLLERLLPRHMQIIFLLNAHFLEDLQKDGASAMSEIAQVSLIDEDHGRRVRMAHLAFIGSHTVNGVSALHSKLMQDTVFAPMHRIQPQKITNVTNGISPRRWLQTANPALEALASELCGTSIADDITGIDGLAPLAREPAVQQRFEAVRLANKQRLARYIQAELGLVVDPAALFDVQIKRMHEYKRQLMNILETIALYDAIRAQPYRNWVPRIKIFAGKAASNYLMAKSIIRLINDVASIVNNDPLTCDWLKVVFLPNYNVSVAELVIPAADVSEQISTAGMEASGTGNMKLALNGALTIGTLDGANIEIRERVGRDNIFIFGLTDDRVAAARNEPFDLRRVCDSTENLADVLDAVTGGAFSPDDRQRYGPMIEAVTANDWFMVMRDFADYWRTQRLIDEAWTDRTRWWRMAITNSAHCGWFSADRATRDYAGRIWRIDGFG